MTPIEKTKHRSNLKRATASGAIANRIPPEVQDLYVDALQETGVSRSCAAGLFSAAWDWAHDRVSRPNAEFYPTLLECATKLAWSIFSADLLNVETQVAEAKANVDLETAKYIQYLDAWDQAIEENRHYDAAICDPWVAFRFATGLGERLVQEGRLK